MNKVIIRSYCEAGCDCPNCHTGEQADDSVQNCVYCQLKWANCGEYNRKKYPDQTEWIYCQCGNLTKKK